MSMTLTCGCVLGNQGQPLSPCYAHRGHATSSAVVVDPRDAEIASLREQLAEAQRERERLAGELAEEHRVTLAISSELSGVRRVLEILDGEDAATADVARNLLERYKGCCATLRVACNQHHLGLGGEQLDVLVTDALRQAESRATRLEAALRGLDSATRTFLAGMVKVKKREADKAFYAEDFERCCTALATARRALEGDK